MADKKTELMAQFYVECQKKGYTDMTDSVQSLKAKVIATDLKLNCDNAMNHYDENGMLVAVTYKNGNLRVNSEITYECQYLLESNMDIDLIWRNLRIVCSGAIWYNAS